MTRVTCGNDSSLSKQQADDLIDLRQFPAAAVDALISFVYSKDYSHDNTQSRFPVESALLFHIHVYCIAESCKVTGLKELAVEKFTHFAHTHWDSPYFGHAIELIYTDTSDQDRSIRRAIVEASVRNIDDLICDNPAFNKARKTVIGFASDLSVALTRRWSETRDRLQEAYEAPLAQIPTHGYTCGQCKYRNITPDAPRVEQRLCRKCARPDHLRRARPTHISQIIRTLKGKMCGHVAYVAQEYEPTAYEEEEFEYCTICGLGQEWIVG